MRMRTTVFAAVTAAIWFTSSAWSQTVYGTMQGGLALPNGLWNQHGVGFDDYSTSVFRDYWSCGNPDGICVGHSTTSYSFFDGEPISVNNYSPAVCDIQDPSVVKFNGTYYLFAGGIAAGSAGCGTKDNEHAALYAFSSPDGVSFSPLNGGNPVIKVPADPSCYACYTGKGINFPSAVAMGSGSFIRVYFHHSAPGYGLIDDGIEAMDTYDGVNFFNERLIANGWAPSVKRVGLYGDYPMVMTYSSGSGNMVATSSSWSDTSWTVGNGGMPISTSPTAGYAPTLESDETGLFLQSTGAASTSPVSGQVNFLWGNNFINGSRLFRGTGNAAQFFNF